MRPEVSLHVLRKSYCLEGTGKTGERVKLEWTIARSGLLLACVAGGASCMRSHPVTPAQGPPVQVQCGFRPGENLTRDQAICIATLIDFDRGVCPWRVEMVGDDDEQEWAVTTTTAIGGTCECGTEGEALFINLHSGRLSSVGKWFGGCNG